MTLSRFLRDYLYVPLGGNRKGRARRYLNLMLTMLLGGLWHGAAWTFVLWGGLHGIYLVANHLFRAFWPRDPARSTRAGRGLAWGLTFVAVVAAWVLFRAEDLAAAGVLYRGMVGLAGAGLAGPHFAGTSQALWLAAAALVAFALPNTQEWMASHAPVLEPVDPARARVLGFDVSFRPTAAWAWLVALLGAVAFTQLTRASEFLYFQF